MPLKFKCPTGHQLTVPNNWGGRVMRCPVCNEQTVVPNPQSSTPPPLKRAQRQPAQPQTTTPNRSRVARMLDEGVFKKSELPQDPSPKPPPLQGVIPERRHVLGTYWLALLMAAVALFAAVPALSHIAPSHDHSAQTPPWVWMMVFIAALQLIYLAWMAMLPDWSTVWAVMWVFAAAAVTYAAGMAILLFTPPGQQQALAFGLTSDPVVRSHALGWTAAAVLATFIACYLAGQLSHRWHKAYQAKLEILRY